MRGSPPLGDNAIVYAGSYAGKLTKVEGASNRLRDPTQNRNLSRQSVLSCPFAAAQTTGKTCHVSPFRNHPFPVVAWFERVVAVSFAFPESIIRQFVPRPLELDSYEGLGFVTVALVWTRQLRPAGFPEQFGQDFFLSGYRVFTRLEDESGRRLRGLRILRSETDKRRMAWIGNLLTRYNYKHVRVECQTKGTSTRIQSWHTDGTRSLDITIDPGHEEIGLPPGSPFPDWKTARRFAGPMPFTFSPEADGRTIVVEGVRENWTPKPVAVCEWQVALFDEPPFRGTIPILANAFSVESIPYRWERGRVITSPTAI